MLCNIALLIAAARAFIACECTSTVTDVISSKMMIVSLLEIPLQKPETNQTFIRRVRFVNILRTP